jgi:aryl-alcohol dehydrogenase-like predicted oxidoreductase
MQYRRLGGSGSRVSPPCLGTKMAGGATEVANAVRIVARAREHGVNFIDTADGDNGGRLEAVTGWAIREHRNWWVLATKFQPDRQRTEPARTVTLRDGGGLFCTATVTNRSASARGWSVAGDGFFIEGLLPSVIHPGQEWFCGGMIPLPEPCGPD